MRLLPPADRDRDRNCHADKDDSLRYQCAGQTWESACRALALVYYQAVRAFGRSAEHGVAQAASSEAFEAYEAAVEAYNVEVKKIQARGGDIQTIKA